MALKKNVDTWKLKTWYSIIAPKFLNEAKVGEVPTIEDKNLINRTIVAPLKEITKNMNHLNITFKLRITEVRGKNAYTKFIGHEVAREGIKQLIRRGRDAIEIVLDATSKDGLDFRVKAIVITQINSSRQKRAELRRIITEQLRKMMTSKDMGSFINDCFSGKNATEIYGIAKKIVPIKKIEIRKTELKELFDSDEKQELKKEVLEEFN